MTDTTNQLQSPSVHVTIDAPAPEPPVISDPGQLNVGQSIISGTKDPNGDICVFVDYPSGGSFCQGDSAETTWFQAD